MQIGLIGGIGPAATAYYYSRLINTFAHHGEPLDLTIVHADAPTLLANLEANAVDAQVAIYSRLTERLAQAGAGCVVVTSIAGHFCIEAFKAISPLPVIDMIQETNAALRARGLGKVGILGTRTVMETRFYGAIDSAEILTPEGDALRAVHDAYAAMATAGQITDDQKTVFDKTCEALLDRGAEAIMLGGTDLALAYSPETAPFALVDCAAVHVDAVVRECLKT